MRCKLVTKTFQLLGFLAQSLKCVPSILLASLPQAVNDRSGASHLGSLKSGSGLPPFSLI